MTTFDKAVVEEIRYLRRIEEQRSPSNGGVDPQVKEQVLADLDSAAKKREDIPR